MVVVYELIRVALFLTACSLVLTTVETIVYFNGILVAQFVFQVATCGILFHAFSKPAPAPMRLEVISDM
jgi:hypothetical protein